MTEPIFIKTIKFANYAHVNFNFTHFSFIKTIFSSFLIFVLFFYNKKFTNWLAKK